MLHVLPVALKTLLVFIERKQPSIAPVSCWGGRGILDWRGSFISRGRMHWSCDYADTIWGELLLKWHLQKLNMSMKGLLWDFLLLSY